MKEFIILKYLKKITILLFISLFIYNPASATELKNLSEAVDMAGKQRMFTQKMLKNYAMIGMNNTFGNPKEDLKNITDEFENHIELLYNFTKDEAVKKSIKEVKKVWTPIKQTLSLTPNKESAEKLQEDLEILLKTTDNTTKLFAKLTDKHYGEIINISGRQRMLSQRMASLYMLKVWGVDDPKFTQKMKETMTLFKTSLDKLLLYDKNTPEITKLLNKTQRSFKFFEFMNKSSTKFIPSLIYKKSNEILKDMNRATNLYTAIENK